MSRRNDTIAVGDNAEAEVQRLLEDRGFSVENLNAVSRNHRTYDLIARKHAREWKISVKCARAKRDLALGVPSSVRRLEADSFLIALLPSHRGMEINIAGGDYEVWVVPASVVLSDALDAHDFYWGNDVAAGEKNTVRVKDKIDAPGGRSKSGTLFANWSAKYRGAWRLLS